MTQPLATETKQYLNALQALTVPKKDCSPQQQARMSIANRPEARDAWSHENRCYKMASRIAEAASSFLHANRGSYSTSSRLFSFSKGPISNKSRADFDTYANVYLKALKTTQSDAKLNQTVANVYKQSKNFCDQYVKRREQLTSPSFFASLWHVGSSVTKTAALATLIFGVGIGAHAHFCSQPDYEGICQDWQKLALDTLHSIHPAAAQFANRDWTLLAVEKATSSINFVNSYFN